MRISLTLLVSLVCIGPLVQMHAHNKTKAPGAQDILAGTRAALEIEGLLHAEQVDTAKSIEQRASQKLSKRRSRQIYFVRVVLRDGANIDAIAVRDNSTITEESGLIVYVVSKVLQPDGKPVPHPK
jgi:high-affinity K+ transport system ATPase subunit B